MRHSTPLRIMVIGADASSAALEGAILAKGASGRLSVVGRSGRVSAGVLSTISHADVAVVVVPRGTGFSAETRRECLSAWSVGATPVLAIEGHGTRDLTEVRAAGEAFGAFAHRLGLRAAVAAEFPGHAHSFVDALLRLADARHDDQPFRMWVEECEHTGDAALLSGPATGSLSIPADLVVLPAGVPATLTALEITSGVGRARVTGQGGVGPGSLLAAANQRPELSDQVAAHIIWASDRPLLPGRSYEIHIGPQVSNATVTALKHRLNPLDLDAMAARQLGEGEIGLVNLAFSSPLLSDPFDRSAALGRFTLFEPGGTAPVAFGRVVFTLRRATNIHWQALSVDKAARSALKGQRPCCLWFTGLSGSGKSTVASLLEKRLIADGRHTYILDGDNVRHGLNRDLGFTDADRVENIRRVGEVARLFVDAGLIVIVSFISPFRAERRMARELFQPGEFFEVFVDTPIEICEQRDPKGLYKKARAGGLKNFTGIDSPYEPPEAPELKLNGVGEAADVLVDQVLKALERRGMV